MARLRNVTVLKYMILVKDDISYLELITEIRRHIQVKKTSDLEASKLSQDILFRRKHRLDPQVGPSNTEDNVNSNNKRNKAGNKNNGNDNNINKDLAPPRFHEYTPTTVHVATIYNENEHIGIFSIPPNIKIPAHKCNNSKYCRYHHDVGHTTEKCLVLKDEVERLIQQGQLRNYVKGNDQ